MKHRVPDISGELQTPGARVALMRLPGPWPEGWTSHNRDKEHHHEFVRDALSLGPSEHTKSSREFTAGLYPVTSVSTLQS